MANKERHRRFGNVRLRDSGRWQARYRGPDGQMRSAPTTFASKKDAERWLSLTEASIVRGDWIDPLLGKITVRDYGMRWIDERRLSPTTVELYNILMRLHIGPVLGDKQLADISTESVRTWRAWLLANGRSQSTAAKAYRLLRAIMNTAFDDGRIKRNPCRIKGAEKEDSAERPVATVGQVFALADEMPPRFRALVLCAAFTSLRWGELIALRRLDLDLVGAVVRVPRRLAQLNSGQMIAGPPKTAAGFRTVALPEVVLGDLAVHVDKYVARGGDALIFTGEKGAVLKRGNWRRSVNWARSVCRAGLPEGFHFHDLRHTGNHLAAASGASTRELMHRMGHASMRAALIYQHATSERDREIAAELSRRAAEARGRVTKHDQDDDEEPDDGPAGALVPVA